ncbi:hypothetical protein LTS07_002092 [Exophiala sideris]|nr:hypothetical protein LTS07_002092 [Exophiala sideris]
MASPVAPNTAEVQIPSGRALGFLDLDKDIRLQVYNILEAQPFSDVYGWDRILMKHSSPDDYNELVETEGTRKSLRLTCWTIAEEWTPAFFRSTTICLNSQENQRTPSMFRDAFLNCEREDAIRLRELPDRLGDSLTKKNDSAERLLRLRDSAIQNIRRIEYNGSRPGMFVSIHDDWEDTEVRCPNMYRSDAKRLREFGAIFRHHQPRLRLETLSVICNDESQVFFLWKEITRCIGQTKAATLLRGATVTRLQDDDSGIQLFFRRPSPAACRSTEVTDPDHDSDSDKFCFADTSEGTSESGDNDTESDLDDDGTSNGDDDDDDDDDIPNSDEEDMSSCCENSEEDISDSESDFDVRSRVSNISGCSNFSPSFAEENKNAFIFPEGWDSDGEQVGEQDSMNKEDDEIDGYPNRKRRFSEVEE